MSFNRTVNEFASILKGAEKRKTSEFDSVATVTRVTDDTIYFQLPGSTQETPASKTIDAREGDTIQVHVSHTGCWVSGNSTAPPSNGGRDEETYEPERRGRQGEDGEPGEPGASIVRIATEFCACTENTIDDFDNFESIMVTEWLDHIPQPEDITGGDGDDDEEDPEEDAESVEDDDEEDEGDEGDTTVYYIWMRTLCYMSDDPEEENPLISDPVYMPNLKVGDDTWLVKIIVKEEKEFCLASAVAIPADGTFEDIQTTQWSTAIPTYTAGNYYWSRTKYYYSDGTVSYSPPFYDFAAQVAHEVAEAETSQDNHFWSDTSGAYVSHTPNNKTSGAVLRAVSEGILLYYNNEKRAAFTQSGVSFFGPVGATGTTGYNAEAELVQYTNAGISFNQNVPFTIGNPSGSCIKWYKENGVWKIAIAADEINLGSTALNPNMTGATGATGPKGDTGPRGATGPQGSQGPAGTVNGVTLTSDGLKVYYDSYNYTLVGSSAFMIYAGGSWVATFSDEGISFASRGGFTYNSSARTMMLYGDYGVGLEHSTDVGGCILMCGEPYSISSTRQASGGVLAYLSEYGGFILDGQYYSGDECQFRAAYRGTNYVWLGIGSQGSNHGVYSAYNDAWILFANTSGDVKMPLVYSGSAKTMTIGSGGILSTSGSSLRYKHDVSDISDSELDPHNLYDLRVAQFKYNEDFRSVQKGDCLYDRLVPGFIAEEVAEVYNVAAIPDESGRPDDWDPRIIIPAMLKLIQEQNARIEALERSN